MDNLIGLLQQCEITTIIAIAIAFFLVDRKSEKRDLKLEEKIDQRFEKVDQRFEKHEKEMDQRFEKLEEKMDQKFDKVDEQLKDIDRRLCRLEGAFSSKDCCMIKDDRQIRKAE